MFGSSDSGSASETTTKSKPPTKTDISEKKSNSTTSLSSQGSSGSFVTMSQGTVPESSVTRGTIGSVSQDMNKIMNSKCTSFIIIKYQCISTTTIA